MASNKNQGNRQTSTTSGKATKSVINEAGELITGTRRNDYGDARESFEQIATLWSIILEMEVTPGEVALCMLALKLSRYLHGRQRDSVVDMIGYAGLLETIGDIENA